MSIRIFNMKYWDVSVCRTAAAALVRRKWRWRIHTNHCEWLCAFFCRDAFVKMQMHECFIYYAASYSRCVYMCASQWLTVELWMWMCMMHFYKRKSNGGSAVAGWGVTKVQCIYDSMHNLCNGWTKTHTHTYQQQQQQKSGFEFEIFVNYIFHYYKNS